MVARARIAADLSDHGGADRGRTEVYAAERMAYEGTDVEERQPFESLEQIARTILTGHWWVGGPVEVRPSRRSAQSSTARVVAGGGHRISLTAAQLTSATLIHEMAHVLAGIPAQHGPRFRRAHVDLAVLTFGAERGAWLAEAYRAAGLPLGDRQWPEPPVGSGAIAL